jgi:Na+/H+ antiporter NhaD/arsenite permease-like protein
MTRRIRSATLLFGLVAFCSPLLHAEESASVVPVPLWAAVPFLLLLMGIAVVPFINRHWWERWYPAVSGGLALVVVAYYLIALQNGERLLHTLSEYVSFIALIGSLFVVSGGIHIRIRGRSTPKANAFLLAIGAVLANIVGTTGASMILIRPWLRVNKYRLRPFHVVFFIFIVSNMGGALTPIGDPPLFLGYLRGVPFFWVLQKLWLPWLIGMGLVLGTFYILDLMSYRGLRSDVRQRVEETDEEGEAGGVQNLFFLAVILGSVFLTHPPFLREALMVAAAVGSYLTTSRDIHKKNDFNFIPIKEVAILFLGIFATMVPALDWLQLNASRLGITTPEQFYWGTGALSSFLDNAPTYLNFLSAAIGLGISDSLVTQVQQYVQSSGVGVVQIAAQQGGDLGGVLGALLRYHYDAVASGTVSGEMVQMSHMLANRSLYLEAISLGAVFFGACTYIGNGPNFMVKSIAEQSGVKCPSFFGYVFRYTIPFLIPTFLIIWYFFFRG